MLHLGDEDQEKPAPYWAPILSCYYRSLGLIPDAANVRTSGRWYKMLQTNRQCYANSQRAEAAEHEHDHPKKVRCEFGDDNGLLEDFLH